MWVARRNASGRALFLVVGVGAGLAGAVASCRAPTQIAVHVESDNCAEVTSTNIAVASTEAALQERSEPQAEVSKCVAPSAGRIGTLVLIPDNAATSEVVFRVVTGINGKPATSCSIEGERDCIFAKRRARFIENETVDVLVVMNARCAGVACGDGRTCNEETGKCEDVPCAGGDCTRGDAGAPREGGVIDAHFDAFAPSPDSGCAAGPCKGECVDGVCVVQCNGANSCGGATSPCQPGVPCAVRCNTDSACNALSCGQASTCTIQCNADQSCKGTVSCGSQATACQFLCKGEGCASPMICSLAAGSQCTATCLGGECDQQSLFCCGAKSGLCQATSPFTESPSASQCR